jgi:hypothetical protein
MSSATPGSPSASDLSQVDDRPSRRFLQVAKVDRPTSGRFPWLGLAWVVTLATSMTLLNALKPLHMDDAVYHMFASQIAAHPADPYGGEIIDYWAPPKLGMDVLAPVWLPYLWSAAIRFHGDNIVLAKLWLAPFPFLLVGSTWLLARRFARGFEPAIAGLVAFAPAILPSMNAMLDVPTLALGLAALVAFARSCDRGSLTMALLAGVLAGAAINTKWTGFLVPAAIGLYALTHRRIGLGLAAMAVSAALFFGWEAWIASLYGRSHFLTHSQRQHSTIMDRLNGAKALVSILGGVAPAVLLLGQIGLERRKAAAITAGVVVLGFNAIALGLNPQAVFLPIGGLLLGVLATVAIALLRRPGDESASPARRVDADSLFLTLWLVLEILGFSVLSPYSAVRRVLGVVVVATLLAGRLASRTCLLTPGRRAVGWTTAAGMTLGLGYFGVDLWEAHIEETAATESARVALSQLEPGRTAWFAGRWGFRDHAARAGLTPLAPGRSTLEPGDLLVVHDNKVEMEPRVVIDPSLGREIDVLRSLDRLPFRIVPSFYAGKDPLQRQVGPRFVVHIYRVLKPFTPLGFIPPRFGPQDRPVGAAMQAGSR